MCVCAFSSGKIFCKAHCSKSEERFYFSYFYKVARQIFVVRKYYFHKGDYSKHLLYFLEVPDSDLYKDVKNHVFVDFIGQDPGGEGRKLSLCKLGWPRCKSEIVK